MSFDEFLSAYIVFAVLILMVVAMLGAMLTYRELDVPVVSLRQIRRDHMADLLTYVVNVAPPSDADVVQRQLVITVNGKTHVNSSFDGTAVDLGSFTVPQDSNVVLALTDVDDAGNSSVPAVVEFVAADTLPPSMPGGVSVILVGETKTEENN